MRRISEVFVNGICLEDILEKHREWLRGEDGVGKADLRNIDLSCTDLSDIDLSYADLRCTNLRDSCLMDSCLRGIDLGNADLRDVDLRDVDLRDANLSCADLSGANLKGADLRDADLSYAILREADLRGADLKGADLNKVLYSCRTSFFMLVCPEEGSFIGYKKADNKIVKLLITEDSKRSSATTRKCRCSKAKVLSVTNIENTEEYNEVVSDSDNNFVYKVGEVVEVKDFDDDRWNECSAGIHFFITRDEAVIY